MPRVRLLAIALLALLARVPALAPEGAVRVEPGG
jgi:hypothetical protein